MQEKTVGGTPAAPLKLDVSVRVIEPVKNLMGFASVKFNDCFVVENLKIVQGSKGYHSKAIQPSIPKHSKSLGYSPLLFAKRTSSEEFLTFIP